jgi:hypothetical protein
LAQGSGFRVLGSNVQGSALPLAAGAASLIEKETYEHPPAMHSAMGWCKYGYINQMVKLASQRFQGIAGRSNIERPTSNAE